MIDLAQILFTKYQQKQLAHFYIISTSNHEVHREERLASWIQDFLLKVIMTEKGLNEESAKNVLSLGHGDILEIRKESATDRYVVDDFEELLYFQNYYNFEFSHRFAIVHNAQQIGDTVANKLLKTLEEPRPGTTIFFLNSSGQNFLPTIRSRAIELKLPVENNGIKINEQTGLKSRAEQIEWLRQEAQLRAITPAFFAPLIQYLCGELSPQEFLNNKKIEKEDWNKLFLLLIDLQRLSKSDFKSKETLLNELQWFQKAQVFNQPVWERFLGLTQLSGLMPK